MIDSRLVGEARLHFLRRSFFKCLICFQEVAACRTDHLTVVEPAESLNASGNELFDEVDFCDYLWILESTDDINYDALQVVWVDKQLL